jgi:hypothetical protein
MVTALRLKSGQARREERNLVIPNERQATLHILISGSTRKDGAIFPQSFVSAHFSSATTHRARAALAREKMAAVTAAKRMITGPSEQ